MQHGFDARVAEIQKENHQREITLEQAIQNGDDRIQDTKRYKKGTNDCIKGNWYD